MTGQQAQGCGNTPVLNPQEGAAIIDWAAYTLPDGAEERRLWEGGPALPFQAKPTKGRYGYELVEQWQAVELWTVHRNSGPHVDASGRGCADIAQAAQHAGSWEGWPAWLAWQIERGAKFSRLDFAVDVVGGSLDVLALADAVEAGHLRSQWEDSSWQLIRGIGRGASNGATLYGGSPSSDTRLVVYDKRAERGLPSNTPPWTRIEFRARHAAAVALAAKLAKGGMKAGMSVVRHYADFRDATGSTLEGWKVALRDAGKSKLEVGRRGGSYDSLARWIEGDVAASLAAYVEAQGGSLDALQTLLEQGRRAQNAKHRTLVEQHLALRQQRFT